MEVSAQASYANACALQNDALLLFKAGRYARAVALAILSEEEFSKAFLLQVCSGQDRWDSAIYVALRKHRSKQAISGVMSQYFDWLQTRRSVDRLHQVALIPPPGQSSGMPSQQEWAEMLQVGKGTLETPTKDLLKQDSLYVSVDTDAQVTSIPDSINRSDAKRCLDESAKFKLVVEAILAHPTAGQREPRNPFA